MRLTPDMAIRNLEDYLANQGISLAQDAKNVFLEIEKICEAVDNPPLPQHVLLACIRTMPKLRRAIAYFRGEPFAAEDFLYNDLHKLRDNMASYSENYCPYSDSEYRKVVTRTILLDLAVDIAKKKSRQQIQDVDILEALLSFHDKSYPPWQNGDWRDEVLHVPFNTLAHILGEFNLSLWVKFDDIRSNLELAKIGAEENLLKIAPSRLRETLTGFFDDHPNYNSNCFLIMSFAQTKFHNEIFFELKNILKQYGFNLLRADDRSYSDDLLTNIETYIYGCGFAVAVFERIQNEIYNPNVSFEVGYMSGLNKPVCYLKEKTLPKLSSDLVGKLYGEFDIGNIYESLKAKLDKWLLDKKLISVCSSETKIPSDLK